MGVTPSCSQIAAASCGRRHGTPTSEGGPAQEDPLSKTSVCMFVDCVLRAARMCASPSVRPAPCCVCVL